jgi:four helix bundle protein
VPVQSYRDLISWQKAMDLAEAIYRETRTFPKQELYGITSQLRRAAISIPSNIAEGQGRRSTGEFRQFLGHALGSLLEVETQFADGGPVGVPDTLENRGSLKSTRRSRENPKWSDQLAWGQAAR